MDTHGQDAQKGSSDMTSNVRNSGLVLFASVLDGGVSLVNLFTDGTLRYAVGGALAPVDINAPVTSQRRVVAATKRAGRATVNMAHLSPFVAQRAGLNGGGTGMGLYANVADAIKNDNRLDRLSKHDRNVLVRLVQERYAQ
jgi:hypothetical protein